MSATPEWVTGAAVFALAGTLVGLAKWGWTKFEKITEARLAEAYAQTEHREELLEKVLTILRDQNEINTRVLARLEESGDDEE